MKKKTDKKGAADTQEREPEQGAEPANSPDESTRLQEQLQRAMADLQNIRKRHVKELDLARQRALEALAAELLPVLDNFQRALAAHEQHEAGAEQVEAHAMVEGLTMVRSMLHGVLERHGLAEIPAMGKSFDPNVHEAVGVDEATEVDPGQVSQVMLSGYIMGDRVIRPAKVFVAGGAGASGASTPHDDEKSGD